MVSLIISTENMTTHLIPDLAARQEALNPAYSYIVQAPAGSGKTELLTQRFLKLLTCVENPESIVALTFTKKAAREMRDRILLALQHPETNTLAHQVLAQDKKYHWQLLDSPNRLRVQTIDGLCASLVAKMPILSQGAPYASITADPQSCYQEAAQRCVADAQQDYTYQKALQVILRHLGNHYSRCIALLSDMLSWREQWLPHLIPAQACNPQQLRITLERALASLNQESEAQVKTFFSAEVTTELEILVSFSEENQPAIQQDFWKKVTHLLLTQDNTWRARIDKNLGFPADVKTMKARLMALLSNLREAPQQSEDCRLALENYRRCPPEVYSEPQWEILHALITLLPLLAAQLKMVFMETQTTDFSEISEQASLALGELENPSELALYLDYNMQHLLIDEFQDTSLKQYQLLEKLIDGWENHDGRTLFIVGDPMQSIYRFREADVSLFLRARQWGIGNIALRSLTLCCNFRSRPALIHWVNACFQSIFPPKDDPHLSAVTHHPSQAGRVASAYSAAGEIHCDTDETPEQQANRIVSRIQDIHTGSPDQRIAILVRSRLQLKYILPQLHHANIAFQGVDIDHLSTRACIRDIYALTQLLLQPGNRLAWLSVLHAPWCGLTYHDLLILSQEGPYALKKMQLTTETQVRLQKTQSIINAARQQRQRQSLSLWIEDTWRKLEGHRYITDRDHQDMEKFWALLDHYTHESLDVSGDLRTKLDALYSNTPQDSNLHIMTIHKSKGLEFDHVILPHLESSSGKKDNTLLQHMERKTQQGKNDLILATMKSIDTQQDAIYQYLQYLDNKKAIFERQRLLYVALTRARAQLHLFAITSETYSENSFFAWLMPFITHTNHTHPQQ